MVQPRHTRWFKSEVWVTVFIHLAFDAGNECAVIDSTITRAHQHSAYAQQSGKTRPLSALKEVEH